MTYIKSKKKGFWLKCDFTGCEEQSFFFNNPEPYYRGWRRSETKGKHLCPKCVEHIKITSI